VQRVAADVDELARARRVTDLTAAAACGVPEVCTPCELQRWARVSRTAS
jgi:hypothetical protein